MSGTMPPVYRSVYPSAIHLDTKSRYASFSAEARRFAGAMSFLLSELSILIPIFLQAFSNSFLDTTPLPLSSKSSKQALRFGTKLRRRERSGNG